MRAELHFELPDEEHDFRDAIDGTDAFCVLHELAQLLRERIKYGYPDTVKTPEAAYEELRNEFYDILSAHSIDLDRE